MGVTECCKLLTTAGAVSRKRVANTGIFKTQLRCDKSCKVYTNFDALN